jgi:hypothetical protein
VSAKATVVVGHAVVVLVSPEKDSESVKWHLQKAAQAMQDVSVEAVKEEIRVLITSAGAARAVIA